MSFKYILVPADLSQPIIELTGDKSGGLENDQLKLTAEVHFSQTNSKEFIEKHVKDLESLSGIKGTDLLKNYPGLNSAAVEITTLLLPYKENNYIGVSIYSDQNSQAKNLELNKRATSIAAECCHTVQIYGDAFFGRSYDNEEFPWERVDFSVSDLDSSAPWVQEAKRMNRGKNLASSSTSGLLQSMMNPNKKTIVDGNDLEKAPTLQIEDSKYISWTQNNDEVEVRIILSEPVKPSDLNIKIGSKKVEVALKSGKPIIPETEATNTPLENIVQKGGLNLYQSSDVDSSTWTLDNKTTIVITLAKNTNTQWPQLYA